MKGVNKLLTCLVAVGFVLGLAGVSIAHVSGPCVNCHTMHNSQGGAAVNASGPFGALVKDTCLGCHTTTTADSLAGGYPRVAGQGFSDMNCLAGGFFPLVNDGTDNLGKAHSLGSKATPPGYNASTLWYKGTSSAGGLSCAGSSGCHGSQTVADDMGSIKGGHHAPSSVYRILYAYDGTATGVYGVGATDFEKALNANTSAPTGTYTRVDATNAHNVYSAGATKDTISRLCANCHGLFHGAGTGTASPWLRHPTEVVLPADWAAAKDAISSNVDCKYNPFGFATGAINTTGTKYATCLSCHRAHGTENYDILRFAYNSNVPGTGGGDTGVVGQVAGSGNMFGCLGCHSKQR